MHDAHDPLRYILRHFHERELVVDVDHANGIAGDISLGCNGPYDIRRTDLLAAADVQEQTNHAWCTARIAKAFRRRSLFFLCILEAFNRQLQCCRCDDGI